MGQHNSPFLSKFGTSMHWFAMHSTKINFTKKLNEDIFLNMFLPLFFKKTFLNKTLFTTAIKEFFSKKHKSKLNFHIVFFSKLWLMRYQNKIIVTFFTYNPKNLKGKILQKNNLSNKQILDILGKAVNETNQYQLH